jgi:hypothetical protein
LFIKESSLGLRFSIFDFSIKICIMFLDSKSQAYGRKEHCGSS